MRKLKRVLKFAMLGLLAVVGVSLIWFAVANAAANNRLEKKLADLKAAGQPIALKDLARPPIPPDQNAATYLRRAREDVNAIQKAIVIDVEDALGEAEQAAYAEGQPNDAVHKAATIAFAAHPQAIPLLRRASECSDYDPQLNYDVSPRALTEQLLDHVGNARDAVRVLDRRVRWLVAEGKNEEALDICLVLHRLCRHFEKDPLLVCYLVSLACRSVADRATYLVLRAGPLSETAYDKVEQELARYDASQAYRHSLSTERAFGLQSFAEMYDDWRPGFTLLPSFKNDQCVYLDWLDTIMQGASRPYNDRQAHAAASAILARAGVFTQLLVPAVQAVQEAAARSQAQARALRIQNALLRRPPALPEALKLTDLGLPAEVLTDPYDGGLMHVRKIPEGWLVYSVGRDLADDGGRIDDGLTDVGLGPIPSAGMK